MMQGPSHRQARPSTFVAGIVLSLLLLPASVFTQTIVTGAINGSVLDPSGAVVTGADVKLTATLTGTSQSTATNSSGLFSFPFLKPGPYVVSATQKGFRTTSESVEVLLGQTQSVKFELVVGVASEDVGVTAAGQLLQTEDANLTTDYQVRQIENFPNPGNDLTNIAQTAPGIMMNTAGGGGVFSAFGLPTTSNLFTINGSDYNDPFLNYNNSGASNLLLGSNEIQEAAVVTNGYTGQYGRQAGAQINYTTKSGTNSFHGNASYSWTGEAMDANDWFNNFNQTPRPFQNNNQWTASLGGPIKKNKIFFFLNTEGLRYIFGTSNQEFFPSPLFQSEVLSTLPAASVPFYQQMFNLYNSAPGIKRAVLAPDSCSSYTPINPAIGTECLVTYRDATTNGNREWLLSARVDVNLSDKDKVFARWKMDRGYQPTYTDPISPVFNDGSNQPSDEGQLNYTHVFSRNVVNSFVGSVLYYADFFGSPDLAKALQIFPYRIAVLDSSLNSIGPQANFPQGRNSTQWQLVDDVSWTTGHHSFKFGGNFRHQNITDFVGSQPFPALYGSFNDFAAGIADFVVGNYVTSPHLPLVYYSLGLYGQDQWAVGPRLKLTLTLRVDRNSPGVCSSGCTSLTTQPFNSPTFSHSPDIPYNQMMVGSKQILRNIEPLVVEPRIGFAYSATDGTTVIRGGAGLFSDLYAGGFLTNFVTNFPTVNRYVVPGTFSIAPGTPGNGADYVAGCNAAFTSNFQSGGTIDTYLNSNPTCGIPGLNDVVQNFKNPKYAEWNLELQHSLSSTTILSLNDVGNYGYDIPVPLPDLNGYGFASLPSTVPDRRVSGVTQYNSEGSSNYNGLVISLNQRVWNGFSGRLNWTWSHASDNVSNGGLSSYGIYSVGGQIDPACLNCLNYAPSDDDVRFYLSASYVWNLPFRSRHGFVSAVVGGWTLSQTFFRRSGYPFSYTDSVTQAALFANNATGSILAYPSGAGPLPVNCGGPTLKAGAIAPCFTLDQFLPAGDAPGFGGTGRNSVRGPGYFNTDLTLRKTFKLTEDVQFSVAAIAFNVLNHPNFTNPVSDLGNSSLFGTISSTVSPPTTPYGAFASAAEDARILQLNGKITF